MTSRLDRALVVALAAVLIATVATILTSTRATTNRAAVAQMEQVMTRVAFAASDEASAFLDPAESFARLMADLLDDDVFDESDPDRLEEFLVDVLRENPVHAGYYVGRPDGDFFYVKRDDDRAPGGFRTKVITVDGETDRRDVELSWQDASGQFLDRVTDPDDDYDPRQRPWYLQAVTAGGVIWTDPYIFFSSRQPGITTAAPIEADGVFGVDLEIRQLSEILSSLPISEEGRALVVDGAGQLVAVSDATDLGLDDGNELRRLRPDELGDPVVDAVWAAMLGAGGPLVDEETFLTFEAEGRQWRAAVDPFATGRWPWAIAVFAPEDDFLGEVRETQAKNTQLGIIVGLIALGMTFLLTTGLTRPLARMRRSAETDHLTSLGNRRSFERRGGDLLSAAIATGRPLSVAMLDLDRFKSVNDSYGHQVGDEVLAATAGRLRRALRDEDLLVRHGGEEFVALLPDTDAETAIAVVERLLAGIRGAPINTSAGPVPTTLSAGLATAHPKDGDRLRPLLSQADEALYEAKRNGRDQVVVATVDEQALQR